MVTPRTPRGYFVFCKVLDGDPSPTSPSGPEVEICKDKIQKYWVYNHFDRESSGYIIPFEYLTLEEESTKDDLVTLYERLGFKEEAPSSDVRYSM